MKARKLPSGSWNVQVFLGRDEETGKQKFKSITATTRQEALRQAALFEDRQTDGTVQDAVEEYLRIKKAVLSPSTYRGYVSIYQHDIVGSLIARKRLSDLTDRTVQEWVSWLAAKHAPKGTKNAYGLFTAAVKMALPRKIFQVTLPQRVRPRLHTPTTEEVGTLVRAARDWDSELYMCVLLGAVGMMRLGEICALTQDDIDRHHNLVRVDRSLARTVDGDYVVKATKTDASARYVRMPSYVMDAIPDDIPGRIVRRTPQAVYSAMVRILDREGIPRFRFHDLRHYGASIAASSSVGAAAETIKARGGWNSDYVMKRVYITGLEDEVEHDTDAIMQYFEQDPFKLSCKQKL